MTSRSARSTPWPWRAKRGSPIRSSGSTWSGSARRRSIRSLGSELGVHPLVLEDLVNTHQSAKLELYSGQRCSASCVCPRSGSRAPSRSASCSTDDLVITVQEHPGDVFEAVRERIRIPRGQIRTRGCDYLLYAIVDAVVDSYFPVLDALTERLEELEEEVMGDPTEETVKRLHEVRARADRPAARRLAAPRHAERADPRFRRNHPGIDASSTCATPTTTRSRSSTSPTRMRDLASDLLEHVHVGRQQPHERGDEGADDHRDPVHPAELRGGRLRDELRPDASPWNMPELGWAYGYPAVVGFMLVVAGGLLLFFRRKGWL